MKKYVFDIDGTICKTIDGLYRESIPIKGRINKINKLFEDGNSITYFTARGMGRTNDDSDKAIELFYDMTKEQLDRWGAKYNTLVLGKPSADLYVDDKGVSDEDFFKSK